MLDTRETQTITIGLMSLEPVWQYSYKKSEPYKALVRAHAPLLAEAAILAMAATALLAFLRADTFSDRLTLALPLGIYAGWLSAAAAVSTGVILAGYGLLSDTVAALAMLVLIVALVLAVQMRQPRAPEYGLTALWALIGVMAANWGQNVIVFLAATLAALALAAAQGLLILRLRRGR